MGKRDNEEHFGLVANTAPVMIWMSDVDKLCTYFNQRWLEFTGRALEAEMGNGWAEGVHHKDLERVFGTVATAFGERKSYEVEYRLRRHDGEYRWVLGSGVPRFNADGSFAGYIGSAIDVTKRKVAEEALSKVSQRLIAAHEEERAWLARELHDDINQRIALLSVNLDVLKNDIPPSASELRKGIMEVSKEIGDLANDTQALSHRLHSSKLEHLGLASAAASFCKELSNLRKATINFHCEDIPQGLPNEISLCLFRVLQESLQNATKYSGSQDFDVSLIGQANEIHLTVRDWGTGFDNEAALKGQGLGLTSMKERMKLVNGELSIESQPGRGTTVHARVPLKARIKAIGAAG
jgi:PAS domain S-box-containing protein